MISHKQMNRQENASARTKLRAGVFAQADQLQRAAVTV